MPCRSSIAISTYYHMDMLVFYRHSVEEGTSAQIQPAGMSLTPNALVFETGGEAIMEIAEAQRDIRKTFLGGFPGQIVSSGVWFLSAAAATWHSPDAAILAVVVGGALIFPITQLLLRLMKRPASLPKGHPMNGLAMQIAFVLPLNLPLVFAATAHHLYWFYPALMIALGSHYLPFIFLYGMWQFGALAAVLISSGVVIAMYPSTIFSLGGWLTAATLLVFAFIARRVAHSETCRAL